MVAELLLYTEEDERLEGLGLPRSEPEKRDFYFDTAAVAGIYKYNETMILCIYGSDYPCVFEYEKYAYLKSELYGR